jgi:iron complex outermembrane receptor protein
VPSLSVQANGADAAAVHIQYALRGLSPNDTLTLVDGKRRHTTSNLAVDGGSIYSGSAGVDINYIPVAAIDHVEVLTDGAAAQYGTDAIAGVVNIILKKNASGGVMTGEAGQDYNGQGATQRLSYNQGFNLNDKGFINLTLDEQTHAHTYVGCGDYRLQNSSCTPLAAGGGTYASAVNLAGLLHGPNYPSENQIYGDPQQAIYNSFINAAYQLTPDIELYGFGNYSYNASEHYENYRIPSKVGACLGGIGSYNANTGVCTAGTAVLAVPTGFSPSEKFDETDYSITGGARGTKYGWNWDLSTTYGENRTQVYVINTDNASTFTTLQNASTTPVSYPTHTIYDGAFDATEWVGQLDVDKSFPVTWLASPLNVAAGLEGRRDTYGITAGEPESYYGGGAQSFAGYSPADDVNASRTNVAGYLDLAAKPIQDLAVDLAGRFEHYSDFGDTESGKLTMRYDFSPQIAIRGTLSNGFRAPTLAEGYYTGLNVGPTSVSGQLAPNSAAAQAAGFAQLKPEQSINYSAGFVLHPIAKLQVTVDAYYILLHDRILPGSGFQALAPYCVPNASIASIPNNGAPVAKTCPAGQTAEDVLVAPSVLTILKNQGVTTAGLTNVGVSAFTNAVNTRTGGVDITATYSSDFEQYGFVDWALGFNYNHTQIAKNLALPAALYNSTPSIGINQTQLLVPTVASALTTAPPREKVILQATWHKGPWSVNLRETVYNDMSDIVTTSPFTLEKIGTTGITDLEIGYKVTSNVKLNIGANNLFDILPPKTPLSATGQPITGNVYNSVYGFAPWGQNGGYYFGRVTLSF